MKEVGGRPGNPDLARWGCFLPDLTRLASGSSAASLPAIYIGHRGRRCKPGPAVPGAPARDAQTLRKAMKTCPMVSPNLETRAEARSVSSGISTMRSLKRMAMRRPFTGTISV